MILFELLRAFLGRWILELDELVCLGVLIVFGLHFFTVCDLILEAVLDEDFVLVGEGTVASAHIEEAFLTLKRNLKDYRYQTIHLRG